MAAGDLSCQELVELVTDYFDDALAPADRARFEAHLDDCAGCRAHLEQMRVTLRLVPADDSAGAGRCAVGARRLRVQREADRSVVLNLGVEHLVLEQLGGPGLDEDVGRSAGLDDLVRRVGGGDERDLDRDPVLGLPAGGQPEAGAVRDEGALQRLADRGRSGR
jgi:anti-sigma factor RsiW